VERNDQHDASAVFTAWKITFVVLEVMLIEWRGLQNCQTLITMKYSSRLALWPYPVYLMTKLKSLAYFREHIAVTLIYLCFGVRV
jgi:hypothetical protein